LFGFDKEEVIGKTASELGILTTEAISAIMMKADSHGNVTNAEADLIAKNGNIKQVLLSSENIFVQNKKFRYTVVNDVTELKKVQESLRESSQKFEAIVSASPDGIGMVTLDGKIQLMSKKLALMYGYSIQEIEGLMGRSIFDFIDVSNHQLLIENMGKLLEGDKDQPITEYQAIKKDNSRFYVDVNSAVLLDSGGNPASVLFVQRDITERKQNEESLKQVTMRLSLAAIAGGVGIWDYDLVNNNLLWDDQMFALYGVDKEHFGGAYNAWLDGVHPDDTARGDEEIQMAISGEKDFNTEFRVLWPDGTIRHIRALAIVQRDDSGDPLRMIGTNWDITAQKHNEQTLRMSEETLRKINADKDKLFSIIAHDLRSPFNGFLGFTDLLVQDLDTFTQEEIRNIAKSMSFSATNLFRLLENLLEWSRMQQGLIRFNCDEAQLLPIVHGSMSTVLEPAKNKGIELSYDIPEGLTIFADINMLLSVIRNLASNAVKFTPKGGKIIISAKVTGDHHVELSIRDSGIGMSSSMVENLFRLDVQTSRKGTEGEPSTGLGLILCKDFIEKHGGKIWVESEEGKGSTFRFTLPTLNQ
jgi:PAS domain S-box-containing protein